MNSRRRALIASLVEDGGEVGRDAPGAAVRLVGDDQVEGRAPDLAGTPWRSAVTTGRWRTPPAGRSAVAETQRSRSGSVVTGKPRSLVCRHDRIGSGDGLVRTHRKELEPILVLAVHSRSVCVSSDSDGTSTSVRSAASFSVMNSAVRVLPVPHAMINWPRSDWFEALHTSLIASR